MDSLTGYTRLRQGFGEAGVVIDRFTGQVIDKQIEVVTSSEEADSPPPRLRRTGS